MPGEYDQLLEATIEHLQQLKARGSRFVTVDNAVLKALTAPAPAAGRPAAMVPSPALRVSPASAPVVTPPTAPVAPKPAEPVKERSIFAPAAGIRPEPVIEPLAPEARPAAMAELRTRALACVKCPNLVRSRTQVVFGVGNVNADIMFVGEAPGADEDVQGEPFVGAAGQLLTKIIQATGQSRDTVYIANILKCRPDMPVGAPGNRKPTPDEMKTCIPYLLEQIQIIRPKVIIALGATAVEGLFGKPIPITKQRGNWMTFRDIPVMPTFHPAYLLRNQAPSEKRKVWEDMLAVMERVGLPISEKQRGYFLKG
jgi:uracil-DNA glycosylase family 4